jgi:hypothetical protein
MPRGRPRALPKSSATFPSQRGWDDLLWDVMQTCVRHDLTTSVRQLVGWMQRDFPEYQLASYRTLRRDVTEAMHWAASRLHRLKLLRDDVMRGFDPAATFVDPKTGKVAGTGLFDEATFDKAVAAAQDKSKSLKLNQDQFKKTLQRLCELLVQGRWPNTIAQIRIVGPKT